MTSTTTSNEPTSVTATKTPGMNDEKHKTNVFYQAVLFRLKG